jgi:hypothetical protein
MILCGEIVAVMQSAESRSRDDGRVWAPQRRARPAGGRLLVQSEMRAFVVVMGDVLFEQSPQMALVPHDDVVEQLAPNAPNPALGDAALPWTPVRRPRRFDPERLHRRHDLRGENRIVIADVVTRLRRC